MKRLTPAGERSEEGRIIRVFDRLVDAATEWQMRTTREVLESMERKLRSNDTWEPIVGDIVFQIRPGFGGMPATLWGKVIKKGSKLRVVPTAVGALLGIGGIQHGKTYPLDDHWTVKDDPQFVARRNAREAERVEHERRRAEAEAEAKQRGAEMIKGKEPLHTWADAKSGDVLATISFTGEKILYRFSGTEKTMGGSVLGIGNEISPNKSRVKVTLGNADLYVKESILTTVRDTLRRLDEAFPAAGRGMEWGEREPVTPEALPDFVARVQRDEGMFVIATYTRMTWFNRKLWDKWAAVGKPMIKASKDGKGFFTMEGQRYVYTQPSSVKWVSRKRVEEGHMRTVRELAEENLVVNQSVVGKQCDDAMVALEQAQKAYGDIMDSLVRGIEGMDIGRGENKMLLRSMHMDMAGIGSAHDRIAALKKALLKRSIAMVPISIGSRNL